MLWGKSIPQVGYKSYVKHGKFLRGKLMDLPNNREIKLGQFRKSKGSLNIFVGKLSSVIFNAVARSVIIECLLVGIKFELQWHFKLCERDVFIY